MTMNSDQDAAETRDQGKQDAGDHDQAPDQGTGQGTDWSGYSGPVWSAAEAARQCGVSRSTLTRRLNAGDIPGAQKTADGWRIPAQGLAISGLPVRSLPADQDDAAPSAGGATEAATDSSAELAQLRAQLETERARREGAENLAAERAARILDLQTALRAIAPPPSDDSDAEGDREDAGARSTPQTATQDASPDASSSTAPRRGLFARLRDTITG